MGSRPGWTPIAVFVAALAAGLLLAVGSASATSIQDKRAQAQAIMAQVEQLGVQVDQASNAYASANEQLQQINGSLASNQRHLVAAKKSLVIAQAHIAQRLRDLYVQGQGDSTLEVILGATSLDDVVTRIDAMHRVAKQDSDILHAVKKYRQEVVTRRAQLKQARADQVRVVAERAAQKQAIESRISEQQRLLASVKDEIVRMQAAERRQQAILAAQARARAEAAQKAAAQAAAQQAASAQDAGAAAAVIASQQTIVSSGSYDPTLPAPRYGSVVSIALQYLGVPYVWGGASPATGFDCSGLVMYVFAQVGISLPHNAAAQYGYGVPVPYDQLQPGDLVFFEGLGHVGIYIGGGQFIHAPHTGDVVRISSLSEHGGYVGARRIT
jgi:cell wall-associated NlpC family hydrolase